MTRPTPGTRDWWVETALITLGGVFLAIWLWDGVPGQTPTRPVTLADLFDNGCMNGDAMAALREGRSFTAYCPEPGTDPLDPTTQNRPFP